MEVKKPFITTCAGDYQLYAIYKNMESNRINIKAEEPAVAKTYKRHIAVFKFTGTWCNFCPEGSRRLDYILEDENRNRYDNAHILAFHGGYDSEPMIVPQTGLLFEKFKLGSFPSVVIDMRDASTNIDISETRTALNKSINDYPAHFGVEIKSDLTGASNMANIEVKISTSMTESYRIIVYAVENNLIYPQLDSSILNDDYRHDHVVRQLVSENYLGDPTGSLIAGGSTIKTYTLSLNENWKKEDLKVYALV